MVNLAGATRTVESVVMDDACQIKRNPAGNADAVLDQSSGMMQDPDAIAWGYQGKCGVSSPSAMAIRTEGQVEFPSGTYGLKLPITHMREYPNDEPAVGDEVLMTASLRDRRLVGRTFVITGIELKTFAVMRRCTMELLS